METLKMRLWAPFVARLVSGPRQFRGICLSQMFSQMFMICSIVILKNWASFPGSPEPTFVVDRGTQVENWLKNDNFTAAGLHSLSLSRGRVMQLDAVDFTTSQGTVPSNGT